MQLDQERLQLSLKASTRVFFVVAFLPYCHSDHIDNSRSMASSSNPPPPAERASEIVNKLPSKPGLITKTGTAVLGTGLAAAAISQELYVVNEESIVLIASIIVFTYIAKVGPNWCL